MIIFDSGTISEEYCILNYIMIIILKITLFFNSKMEETSVIMTGLEKDRVNNFGNYHYKQKGVKFSDYNLVKDYSVENVSSKIVRLIIIYLFYVIYYVSKK